MTSMSASLVPEPEAAEPPEWLSMTADFPRYHQDRRRINIGTTNGSDEEIEITRIALRAEHFTEHDPEEKTSRIGAGAKVNIQADLGQVVACDDDGSLTATVEVELRPSPGAPTQGFVVPIDPEPLDEIHARECGQKRVTDAVAIDFGADWVREGATIHADIVLERRAGDDAVTVESLRGTEVLIMQPEPFTDDTVALLEQGTSTLAVPVRFEVLRCDPHAAGQSSRSFEFKLWVAAGDADPQFLTLDPDEALRAALQSLITECLEAGSF